MHGAGALPTSLSVPGALPQARVPRPVRSLRIIDPFCGPGHLLIAAFDALVALHEGERELAQTGEVPADWLVPPSDVAATIIEEQIVGVDIDEQAVTVARAIFAERAREWGEARRLRPNIVALAPGLGTFDREACDELQRRYDVVVMNPPYGGQRQLDPGVWREVSERDPLARSDLAVAAISRGWELVAGDGCLAVLAPATWLASTPALSLRGHLCGTGHPRLVVSLGQRVFADAPLVFAAICVLDRTAATADDPITEISVASGSGEAGLRIALERGGQSCRRSVALSPTSRPFRVRAPEGLLATIGKGPTIGQRFEASDGRWVRGPNAVRFFWELPPGTVGWRRLAGGQGYQRWHGATRLVIRDSAAGGAIPAGRGVIEYGRVAGGRLSSRRSVVGSFARAGVVRLRARDETDGGDRVEEVLAIANTRVGTAWLQTLTAGLNFNPGYLGQIPLGGSCPPQELRSAVRRLVGLRRQIAEWDLTADEFRGVPAPASFDVVSGVLARVAALETVVEGLVADHLGLCSAARAELEATITLPAVPGPTREALASDHLHEVLLRALQVRWPRSRRTPIDCLLPIDVHGILALRSDLGTPSVVDAVQALLASGAVEGVGDLLVAESIGQWVRRFPDLHRRRFRDAPVAWCVLGGDGTPLALANAHLLGSPGARIRLTELVRRSDGARGVRRLDVLDAWKPDWSEGVVAAARPLVEHGLVAPK